MLGVYTRWFNDWALLVGWAVGTFAGIWMFVAAKLTPNYPLAFAGHTFPGYTALYTVILNLVVAIVLTPVFNAMGAKQTSTQPCRAITTPEPIIAGVASIVAHSRSRAGTDAASNDMRGSMICPGSR